MHTSRHVLHLALGVFLSASTLLLSGCFCNPQPGKTRLASGWSTLPRPGAGDPPSITLTNNDTAGTFKAGTVTVPAGTTIVLTGDLIISGDTVNIDGRIEFPKGENTAMNISVLGVQSVTVGPNGYVGGGKAGPGDSDCTAPKDSGWHGGLIQLISGGVLTIEGIVLGQEGGDGVARTDATATSGNGGQGGDVLLSAIEIINVSGRVDGGLGGIGGNATSDKPWGAAAVATAGSGDTGGHVRIEHPQASVLPGSTVPVRITGSVTAGTGGSGGTARATGDSYSARGKSGENATATGGNGGNGGDIMCAGVNFSGIPTTGTAGAAGPAFATGGNGANATWYGPYAGGSATATGGNGGKAGTSGSCPGFITPGANTGGATASAASGSGGSNSWWGFAGSSGTATATGGANGAGTAATPATAAATPPSAPTGTGGAGATVISPGVP